MMKKDWKITLADIIHKFMTGSRISKIKNILMTMTTLYTYGDGVSDVDINNNKFFINLTENLFNGYWKIVRSKRWFLMRLA